MQHLDRGLEHLDEFEQALGRAVEPARIGIGVRVVLTEKLELADIDLADEARDVLVVLVARLGLGNADLLEPRGLQADDGEFGDVAAELLEPFDRPRRDRAGQPALRDAIAIFKFGAQRHRVEQPEWAFEHRTDLLTGLQHIDRLFLHQLFQPFGERGFAAADWAQQINDLLALLEPLRGVPEEPDDPLDRFLHPEEIRELRIDLDRAVHEDAAEAPVLARIDHRRLADCLEHALGRTSIEGGIVRAFPQIVLQRKLYFPPGVVQP